MTRHVPRLKIWNRPADVPLTEGQFFRFPAPKREGDPVIRTLHHFACSGGTLISKCIAAQRKVTLLSEVHPDIFTGVRYNPTALVQQFQAQTNLVSPPYRHLFFVWQLKLLESLSEQNDRVLVLRDHTHYDFILRDYSGTPVRTFASEQHETRSLVTVRHPVESFVSAKKEGWLTPINNSFDEYCRRYLQFLNCYEDCNVYYYEEFCQFPEVVMQMICADLELEFNPNFQNEFSAFELTGDSGRKSCTIALPAPKEISSELEDEILASAHWHELIKILNYRFSSSEGATMRSVQNGVAEESVANQVIG